MGKLHAPVWDHLFMGPLKWDHAWDHLFMEPFQWDHAVKGQNCMHLCGTIFLWDHSNETTPGTIFSWNETRPLMGKNSTCVGTPFSGDHQCDRSLYDTTITKITQFLWPPSNRILRGVDEENMTRVYIAYYFYGVHLLSNTTQTPWSNADKIIW